MTTYRWQYKLDDDLFLLAHKAVAATVPYPRDLQRWFRQRVVFFLCKSLIKNWPMERCYEKYSVDVRMLLVIDEKTEVELSLGKYIK